VKEGTTNIHEMRAAWYEKQGPAREVSVVGEMPEPLPGPGEVRTGIVSTDVLQLPGVAGLVA